MTGGSGQSGTGYGHAGGYRPNSLPTRRDFLVGFCSATSIFVVSILYRDFLAGPPKHALGLGLGLAVIALWLWGARIRSQADEEVPGARRRTSIFVLYLIVVAGFASYCIEVLREAGGWQ
jgi:hypothetical protein